MANIFESQFQSNLTIKSESYRWHGWLYFHIQVFDPVLQDTTCEARRQYASAQTCVASQISGQKRNSTTQSTEVQQDITIITHLHATWAGRCY